MSYTEMELQNSKKAYDSANKLSKLLNGKLKDLGTVIEMPAWIVGGMIALFYIGVSIYGTAGNSAVALTNLYEVLPSIAMVLAPAIGIRCVRAGTRAIINGAISRKIKRASLYEKHKVERMNMLSRARIIIRNIDNVIAKSNDEEALKVAVIKLQEAVNEVEKEVTLESEQEIEQIVEYHVQDVAKKLPDEERKRLGQIFKGIER